MTGNVLRRADLRVVAEAKLADAGLLLAHGRFGNAYYLSGYAVEIALKACIAKTIEPEVIPDKRFINSIYEHDLRKLINTAGLELDFKAKQQSDADFSSNWTVVSEWSPSKRYGNIAAKDAHDILSAISSPDHGVLQWIRAYW